MLATASATFSPPSSDPPRSDLASWNARRKFAETTSKIQAGARLREILGLKWEYVDIERGLLFLPDSKTGRKTIVLNTPALAVLSALPRVGSYVIMGDDPEKSRHDLNRPWKLVSKQAALEGVRLHDLRHTHASFGAAAGLGLPIIGKLLGHTQPSTTQRYAHLDLDPLRRASNNIGNRLAAAMGDLTTNQRPSSVAMSGSGRKADMPN